MRIVRFQKVMIMLDRPASKGRARAGDSIIRKSSDSRLKRKRGAAAQKTLLGKNNKTESFQNIPNHLGALAKA